MEITETIREEQVEIGFTVTDEPYTFMDRFTLPKKVFDGMLEEDITKMETDRYNAWLAELTRPPHDPTKEELQAQSASAQQQINYWTAEKARLDAAIDAKG